MGRLKRAGRQRRVLVPEHAARPAPPRLFLPAAQQGAGGRVLAPGRERWAAASLPAFGKPGTGLAAAQVRQEEAVTRHGRVRGGAPARRQRAATSAAASESGAVAPGALTSGQQARALAREALEGR